MEVRNKTCVQNFSRKTQVKRHLENLDVYGRVVLKRNLRDWDIGCRGIVFYVLDRDTV
jgi:hypothetical protein